MKALLAIVGAGGHTRSLINLVDSERFAIEGIYDESYSPAAHETIRGIALKGDVSSIPTQARIVLAIGGNAKRAQFLERLCSNMLQENLVHSGATIEADVKLGICNQIFAGAYINSCVALGDNNIINTNCVLEHEAVVGNHCHISVNSVLCGRVCVGNRCFVGAAAVVIDKVKICDDVTIGANSVVVRNIEEPGVYVGNPVRKIR